MGASAPSLVVLDLPFSIGKVSVHPTLPRFSLYVGYTGFVLFGLVIRRNTKIKCSSHALDVRKKDGKPKMENGSRLIASNILSS